MKTILFAILFLSLQAHAYVERPDPAKNRLEFLLIQVMNHPEYQMKVYDVSTHRNLTAYDIQFHTKMFLQPKSLSKSGFYKVEYTNSDGKNILSVTGCKSTGGIIVEESCTKPKNIDISLAIATEEIAEQIADVLESLGKRIFFGFV